MRFLFLGLIVFFVVSPFPLGGNRGWAMLALSGLIFLLLALYLLIKLRQSVVNKVITTSSNIDPTIYLIVLVAFWILIQGLFKIPIDWLHCISPVTKDFYLSTFDALNVESPPSAFTLSLNAPLTINRGILALCCVCILVLMHQLINTRKRLVIFCYALVLSGVFQSIYGVMMTLTGMEYLFFTPKTKFLGNATGTFVNRNHLAGYLEMTLAVGIGLLLGVSNQPNDLRGSWGGVLRMIFQMLLSQLAILRGLIIIMVIGILMTHSRMGNAAFFNSLLITGSIALMVSKHFRKPSIYIVLSSIILVDVFLLGSIFDLDKVFDRLENTGLDKEKRDEVVKYASSMLPDFWLFGSGANTFSFVFPGYVKEYIGGFYDYAHNDYLQILLEFGVIGSLPLVLFISCSFIRSWLLLRSDCSTLTRGIGFSVIMTTISLSIHSLVDFNLQIPANIILFVSILGLPWISKNIMKHPLSNV